MRYSSGTITFAVLIAGVIYAIISSVRHGDPSRSFIGLVLEFALISAAGFGVAWAILHFAHGLGRLIG